MSEHDAVAEALRVANIPEDVWGTKGAGLSAPERALYRAILRAFPELGGPPGPERVRAEARALGVDPETALTALARRDLIVRHAATGAIAVAYPFSAAPTSHRVRLAGARPVYAMCAVDALGIPFMLGRDATINSVDPTSGEPVRVAVRGDAIAWEPPGAVVFVGRPPGGRGPECCSVIYFFRSAASAEAHRRAHPDLDGRVLPAADAVEAGRRVFGELLAGDKLPGCGDDGCRG